MFARRHVRGNCDCAFAYLVCNPLGRFATDVQESDLGTFACEVARDSLAESTPGASDYCHSIVQFHLVLGLSDMFGATN